MKTIIRPILAATLAIALTFTLGCEEKFDGKSSSSSEKGLSSAAVSAMPNHDDSGFLSDEEEAMMGVVGACEKLLEKAVSCKGSEKVKLLAGIADKDCKLQNKFEYDEQNRIVKMYDYREGKIFSTKTIAYSSDDLITVEYVSSDNSKKVKKFIINGNTITSDDEKTFNINKDGYAIKRGIKNPEYENGNRTSEIDDDEPSGIGYTYDNKKSPFSNTNTPKWLLQYDLGLFLPAESKNNVASLCTDLLCHNYEYEYDSEGFPTKQKEEIKYHLEEENQCENDECTRFTYFFYCGGGKGDGR